MDDDADRIEFLDVVVLACNQSLLLCRVDDKLMSVPRERMLPGTTVRTQGDCGTLVLPLELARVRGLT